MRHALELAAQKVDGKSIDDWVSWHVEVFKIVQTATIAKFADYITSKEGFQLTIRNRIPCQAGQKHKKAISECYSQAYQEYIYITSLEPNSEKHQKKRRSRHYSPYIFDFIPCNCGP